MKKSSCLTVILGAVAVLLVAVGAVIVLSPVGTVLADAIHGSGVINSGTLASAWHKGGWGHGSGFTLPPELQGLTSIPADQRFAHFEGAQINLKDQNNQPLSIQVIPGKVTRASTTSLDITANNGNKQAFQLNAQTVIHGKATQAATPTSTPASSSSIAVGDSVIVVTLNNSTTATAVVDGGAAGFQWSGMGGW
jgi:hypothetical protein